MPDRSLSPRDLEAIEKSVEAREIHLWAPLKADERDLVRRALAPATEAYTAFETAVAS